MRPEKQRDKKATVIASNIEMLTLLLVLVLQVTSSTSSNHPLSAMSGELPVTSPSAAAMSPSTKSMRELLFEIPAEECNRTLTLPERVRTPEVMPSMKGSFMLCTWKIRPDFSTFAHYEMPVIKIEFQRLRLGHLLAGSRCSDSVYMVIYDGGQEDLGLLGHDPGRFCGQHRRRHVFYAERTKVDIMVVVESLDESINYDFDVTFVPRNRLQERFGPRPKRFPNATGELIEDTYCEKAFKACSPHSAPCYVQSPGYPGIYPRNLRCRYYLSTESPLIKLYTDLSGKEMNVFDVDSQACDHPRRCVPRNLTSKEPCDRDLFRLYDGVDEFSPLIGTFCGRGAFPAAVVGTGSTFFIEFQTAKEGPFLGEGFDFRVSYIAGESISLVGAHKDELRPLLSLVPAGTPFLSNSSLEDPEGPGAREGCNYVFNSTRMEMEAKEKQLLLLGEGFVEGNFNSLSHWYPPDTTCTYAIIGSRYEMIRLSFPRFLIGSGVAAFPMQESPDSQEDDDFDSDCDEYLEIYDAPFEEASKLMGRWCSNSHPGLAPSDKADFLSTSNALYVQFHSKVGSYAGSQIKYKGNFDFFDTREDGTGGSPQSPCGMIFPSDQSSVNGSFQSPRNTLLYKNLTSPLRCDYTIVSAWRQYSRIRLVVSEVNLRTSHLIHCSELCWGNPYLDHLEIYDPYSDINITKSCVANCSLEYEPLAFPLEYISNGPELSLSLFINDATARESYFRRPGHLPLFLAHYERLHPPGKCGNPLLSVRKQPSFLLVGTPVKDGLSEDLFCSWDLTDIRSGDELQFVFTNFTFHAQECDRVRLEIWLPSASQEDAEDPKPLWTQCSSLGTRILGDELGKTCK